MVNPLKDGFFEVICLKMYFDYKLMFGGVLMSYRDIMVNAKC